MLSHKECLTLIHRVKNVEKLRILILLTKSDLIFPDLLILKVIFCVKGWKAEVKQNAAATQEGMSVC